MRLGLTPSWAGVTIGLHRGIMRMAQGGYMTARWGGHTNGSTVAIPYLQGVGGDTCTQSFRVAGTCNVGYDVMHVLTKWQVDLSGQISTRWARWA
eukprot:5524938-Amphidinium_carterae.2